MRQKNFFFIPDISVVLKVHCLTRSKQARKPHLGPAVVTELWRLQSRRERQLRGEKVNMHRERDTCIRFRRKAETISTSTFAIKYRPHRNVKRNFRFGRGLSRLVVPAWMFEDASQRQSGSVSSRSSGNSDYETAWTVMNHREHASALPRRRVTRFPHPVRHSK